MAAELPDAALIAALSTLPGMGPRRLAALLDHYGPIDAIRAVESGRCADDAALQPLLGRCGAKTFAQWRAAARVVDADELWASLQVAGVRVGVPGSADYPEAFLEDPEPPSIVFSTGPASPDASPAVAIVGTRNCTRYGHDVARELGGALASAGVAVVSGLALGIDAAAHWGALGSTTAALPVIGVVGSGLDVCYPRQNRDLWNRVRTEGVLLSECPPGTAPAPWRFPARNRLIAALADIVVVVESHASGGSMHTVAEATTRDRLVMAVPGPIRAPSSVGTNRLISEGVAPVCDVDDVLMALGLIGRRPASLRGDASLTDTETVVVEALGWEPATIEDLASRTALAVPALSAAVEHLVRVGRLARSGPWIEQVSDV